MRIVTFTLLSCVVAAFAVAQEPATANAELKSSTGKVVGKAMLRETPNGVLIKVDLQGVPAGPHAFHVHTTGKCDPPDFQTAGGHFAPGGTKHGLLTNSMPHAGDLPNVHVPASGNVSFEVLAPVTLGAGQRSLLDADGSALMVHAGADDYASDPAGNAGGRIACGVVTANRN